MTNIKNLKIVLLLVGMIFCTGVWAQSIAPKISAKFTPDSIAIGDHFMLDVELERDMVQSVEFPLFQNNMIGEFIEILSESPVDTLSQNGRRLKLHKQYKLTSFKAGLHNLGGFPMLYMDKNTIDTLESIEPLVLQVTTFEIDTTTQQIYDIKEPLKMPLKAGEFSGYLIGGAWAAVILGVAIWYLIGYYKRRKAQTHEKPVVTIEKAHEQAIRELEQLQAEKLWQNGRHKLYYTRLSDILREYIENRFLINAMEMTTAETMLAIKEMIAENPKMQLGRVLTTADYVKFAKYTPGIEDNEMSYNDAYYFVESTKMQEEPATEEKTKKTKNSSEQTNKKSESKQ